MAAIARVHHERLSDRLTPGAKRVHYARRGLLGWSEQDWTGLADRLTRILTEGL